MYKVELSPKCPFMTVEQAAKLIGVSSRTIYNMCKDGELKCTKFGKSVRINKAAMLEYAGVTEAEYMAAMAE